MADDTENRVVVPATALRLDLGSSTCDQPRGSSLQPRIGPLWSPPPAGARPGGAVCWWFSSPVPRPDSAVDTGIARRAVGVSLVRMVYVSIVSWSSAAHLS